MRERFWSKVDLSGDCWEWQAAKNAEGYGQFSVAGRQLGAHVVAFTLTHGEVPDGLCVLHHCDNPSCVRPSHLYCGTHADNAADRSRRDRAPVGEAHCRTKISDRMVVEARRLYATGQWSQRQIAEHVGMSTAWVSYAVRGLTRRTAAAA